MDARLTTEVTQPQVCLAARDLSAFSLLVEDLHTELGENWGELTLVETNSFLGTADACDMKLLIVAADEDDRSDMAQVEQVIAKAQRIGLPTLLVAEDLTDLEIYQLTHCGATPHMEYPLQEGDLAISLAEIAPDLAQPLGRTAQKGDVFAVQGIAGGAGSSTLAVNLARELSALNTGTVCLIDLDVQFGSIGMELGLHPSEAVLDLLFDAEIVDQDWMTGILQSVGPNLSVLTAPADVIPLDSISPHGLIRLLAMAQTQFDYVVVDMPKSFSEWTHVVFDWADTIYCPVIPSKKASALVDRFRQTCLGEGLPLEKMRFIANRASKTAVADIERLSIAAGQPVSLVLPDGGAQVGSSESFAPMSAIEPRNALGQEICKLAQSLSERRVMAA